MWFRRTRPSAESGFGVFRPGEGLLRGPPSGEGPLTGHSALPTPPNSHVSTNAVPITMNAKPMPPRRAAPVSSSYGDFCTVSQQTAPDFDMVPGVLGGLSAPLFDACFADLGKRRRHAAFRADSACKTAQKSLPGFACDMPRHAIGEQLAIPLRGNCCVTLPAHLPRL